MIDILVHLHVKHEHDIHEVSTLLQEQGRLSRAEPGCVRFEVYQDKHQLPVFFLVERWESQEALDEHRKGVAYTTIYQPQVLPKVDRTPHPVHLISG